MDNTISGINNYAQFPGAAQRLPAPEKKEGEPPASSNLMDLVKTSQPLMGMCGGLKAGEKVIFSVDGDKLIVSKEGPDGWDKFKAAAADTSRTAFRVARGVVEQDPSFAFRESVEVAKSSVERILPPELGRAMQTGLYPVLRVVLSAIDVHKAIKTKRDTTASVADKIIDYGHILTDAGGLLAIAAPLANLSLPGVGYFAGAAIIGDIVAGGWHALRFAAQGASKLALEKPDTQSATPAPVPTPAPTPSKVWTNP
ncbi:MAG: hypothetical protein AB2L14_03040 [Candidatus Xenobiia bacterium LiM19]